MDYKNIVAQLRSVSSRSKGQLLCEAADAIETLQAELTSAVATMKDLDMGCLVCDHNHREAPCVGTDYGCYDGCPFECPCKGCKDDSKWTWHGMKARDDDGST